MTHWKNHWVLNRKVRFEFRKFTKVGRSIDRVRLKVSALLVASHELLSANGIPSNQVNSKLQFDLLKSSAKSIEKPSTLRFS